MPNARARPLSPTASAAPKQKRQRQNAARSAPVGETPELRNGVGDNTPALNMQGGDDALNNTSKGGTGRKVSIFIWGKDATHWRELGSQGQGHKKGRPSQVRKDKATAISRASNAATRDGGPPISRTTRDDASHGRGVPHDASNTAQEPAGAPTGSTTTAPNVATPGEVLNDETNIQALREENERLRRAFATLSAIPKTLTTIAQVNLNVERPANRNRGSPRSPSSSRSLRVARATANEAIA